MKKELIFFTFVASFLAPAMLTKIVFLTWLCAVAVSIYFALNAFDKLGNLKPHTHSSVLKNYRACGAVGASLKSGAVTAMNCGTQILEDVDAHKLLESYPYASRVQQNSTMLQRAFESNCSATNVNKFSAESVLHPRPGTLMLFPAWCHCNSTVSVKQNAISLNKAYKHEEQTAARGLLIGDGFGVPISLVGFAVVTRSKATVVLPVIAAAVTITMSIALLGVIAENTATPTMAINIQCAFAFSLAIDYSMFLVMSPQRGKRTILVSASILLSTTASLLLVRSEILKAIALASLAAILSAVIVSLTLSANVLRAMQKGKCVVASSYTEETVDAPGAASLANIACNKQSGQTIDSDDDDDSLLQIQEGDETDNLQCQKTIFAERHPFKILFASCVIVALAIWKMSSVRMCGGAVCAAPYGPALDEILKHKRNVVDTSLLVASSEEPFGTVQQKLSAVAACLHEPVQRQYTVGNGIFVDVATPIEMSAEYVAFMTNLTECLPPNIFILSLGLSQYYEMMDAIKDTKLVAVTALIAVFAVIFFVYRAPVIAVKAVCAVASTFITALAVVALAFNNGICWMVPIIAFPVGIGLGMDFHVFFLEAIVERSHRGVVHAVTSSRRVITGAGIVLTVAFFGLLSVQLMFVQQLSTFLGTTILIDTLVMRSQVIPAAMFILGSRNWKLLPCKK